MPCNFDVTLLAGDWTIGVDNDLQYGYFENNKTGDGGGLWFSDESGEQVLIDYDGVFELPEPVASALKEYGYIIEEL